MNILEANRNRFDSSYNYDIEGGNLYINFDSSYTECSGNISDDNNYNDYVRSFSVQGGLVTSINSDIEVECDSEDNNKFLY